MGRDQFLKDTASFRSVAFDTNACIYFLRGEQRMGSLLMPLVERASTGDIRILVSAIVQMELLVRPYQLGDRAMLEQVLDFTEANAGVTLCAITRDVVYETSRTRAELGLKLPDAMIVANARVRRADAVIGNDARFQRMQRPVAGSARAFEDHERPEMPRYLHLNDYAED